MPEATTVINEVPKTTTKTVPEAASMSSETKAASTNKMVPEATTTTMTDKERAMLEFKSKAMERKKKLTLQPRVASSVYYNLEYSVHIIPKPLVRDLEHVFPGGGIKSVPTFSPRQAGGAARYVNIMIPVMQRSDIPLLSFGMAEEREKDRLMHKFFEWVTLLKMGIQRRDPHAWVDCTDPSSGRAHYSKKCGSGFSDVEGICAVDTYPTEMAGVCRIMRHPTWDAAVYPTLVFVNAKWDTVKDALGELNGNTEEESEEEAVQNENDGKDNNEKTEG